MTLNLLPRDPNEEALACACRDGAQAASDVPVRHDSADSYTALFNSLDAGFCVIELIFDEAGRPHDYLFLEVNPAFAAHSGLSAAAGKRMRELAPAHEQHWFDLYGAVAISGRSTRFENYAHALDGRWFDVQAFRVGAPAARRVAVLFTDITARKRAESRLQASEAQFRGLAEAMPHHVWTADAQGRLDWANQRLVAELGPTVLSATSWSQQVHPDDLTAARAHWQEAVDGGATFEAELRLRLGTGGFKWYLVRAVPMHDARGQVQHWVGTNTDVNEQHRMREQLAALNEQLATEVRWRTDERNRIWEMTPDLLACACVHDGRLLAVNPAWTQVLGYTESELLDNSLWSFLHPDSVGVIQQALDDLRRGETVRMQSCFVAADGRGCWFDWVATAWGERVYAVARDVTAMRARQAELERAQDALRQAQKMEAVGQLTGGVAHDFNNLLQVVSGNLQLIGRMVQAQPALARRVGLAQEAVRRGAKVAEQLLAFGRRQNLDPRPVAIGPFLLSMEDMLRQAAGAAMTLQWDVPSNMGCAMVDPLQLETAILNLVINARDAMNAQGSLLLRLRCVDVQAMPRDQANASGPRAGQYMQIDVQDSGCGMSDDVLQQAFDPFFSTKTAGAGSGLGLSMVYGFAQQSAGHVSISSRVGMGTTVRLLLPRTEAAEAPAPGPVARAEEPTAQGTVLLVEDDLAVQDTVASLLVSLGYQVKRAGDAGQALQMLEAGLVVDLLLTDVVMPGALTSKALVTMVQSRWPDVAVVYTSGYVDHALLEEGTLTPGVLRLAKPYTSEQLARVLREACSAVRR